MSRLLHCRRALGELRSPWQTEGLPYLPELSNMLGT
jgi:hypothetical protein